MTNGDTASRKWHHFGASLIILLLFTATTKAQFLDLNLNIDSKITTKVHRPIQFESLPTKSGQYNIDWGAPTIGIYSITALEHQSLLLNINLPKQLHHSDSAVQQHMPVQLAVRYGYKIREAVNASAISQKRQYIQIKGNPNPTLWNTLYLFISGSLTKSNVPEGRYQNDLTIEIEYL